MSELPLWAYPAITFATLLAMSGIVYLVANARRNGTKRDAMAPTPAE